jgi:proteic killer suppression protein
LFALDNAATIDELDIPGFRLHKLQGDPAGLWSIGVNGNWRVTFRFANGETSGVNLIDYH